MTDEARPKRQRGRPPKSAELRKAENVTIRMLGGLKRQVERAAAASGRSMSEEIAHRVESSFGADEARANSAEIITKLDGLHTWAQAIARLVGPPLPHPLRDAFKALASPPLPHPLRDAFDALASGAANAPPPPEPVAFQQPPRVAVHYYPPPGWAVTPVVTINTKLDNEAA